MFNVLQLLTYRFNQIYSYITGKESYECRMSRGGWSTSQNDIEQWLMIDIGTIAIIQEIITKKSLNNDEWVSQYSIGTTQIICI